MSGRSIRVINCLFFPINYLPECFAPTHQQSTKNKEQSTINKEQRTKNKEQFLRDRNIKDLIIQLAAKCVSYGKTK